MKNFFSSIPNRFKAIYLVWFGTHLTLYLISGNALFETRNNEAFYPLRDSWMGSFFEVRVYDIREFLFYLIIPIVIYYIIKLWNRPNSIVSNNSITNTILDGNSINNNSVTYSAEDYYTIGGSKYVLLDYDGAIRDFGKAIEIKPNYFEAYLNRGCVKYELSDYKGAIEDFNKAIEINPSFAEAYDHRGRAKYKLLDYFGAVKDYNKVIELEPDAYADDKFYINRGKTKYELSEFEDAIRDYDKAIESDPDYSVAYYNRGISKYKLGDKDGACLDWSKAGELGNKAAYNMIKKYCSE